MQYLLLASFESSRNELFDADTWKKRHAHITGVLRKLWGAVPRTPEKPTPEHEWIRNKSGYRIGKCRISVEESGRTAWDIMPFYMLMPENPISEPCPVVIVHHQHAGRFDLGGTEPAGLEGDPIQALGAEFARRGFIAVCPDALCFGERQEASEIFTAMTLLMQGRTLNFKYIWDISRLIDHLASLPSIDSNRIAIAGHSLGGQMAVWCAAYEPRIKAVISNCGLAKIDGENSVISNGITHNMAFYLPGMISGGITMKDIAGLVFPRPFFLSAGKSDAKFPIEGVVEIHAWLELQYAFYDHQDNLVTLRHDGGHMMPEQTKESMNAFLDKFLAAEESKKHHVRKSKRV